MELWRILVMGVLKEGLGCDYARAILNQRAFQIVQERTDQTELSHDPAAVISGHRKPEQPAASFTRQRKQSADD